MLAEESLPFLIVIADREFVGETKNWLRVLSELSESMAGNRQVAIQVRVNNVNQVEYQDLAHRALNVLGPDTRTILNGTVEEAQRLGYWGAHTQATEAIKVKQVECGLDFVSAPVHDEDQLHAAEQSKVSAVLCSPVFQPSWKRVDAMGIPWLRQMTEASNVPVYALGGVTPIHCKACLDAGSIGVAVLSGVMGATNPNEAVAEYLRNSTQN